MKPSDLKLTRENILELLGSSSTYGNLGAFIGSGFSKAVLNDDFEYVALSWGELLEYVSKKIEVDYDKINKEGVGYPEIASQICQEYADAKQVEYSKALSILKKEISTNTAWYPTKEQREKFSHYLSNIDFSWIITTNYDLVIEALLIGSSIPLGPNDPLIAPKNTVPVFHLHGLRTNPDEIIIAQEDYVGLFRPTEYRQIKLALMIKESTMLIIGYGLGDVNVLTALDWSKNVYKGEEGNYPNEVIQVVRKNNPKEDPYRDKNSIIIVETNDLEDFFRELYDAKKEVERKENETKKELKKISKVLNEPGETTVNEFIDKKDFRDEVLEVLSNFSNDLISGFVSGFYPISTDGCKTSENARSRFASRRLMRGL